MDGITDSTDMNSGKLWETMKDREAWHAVVYALQRTGHNLAINNNKQQKSLIKRRRDIWSEHAQRKGHVRVQRVGSHLQVKE